MTIVANTYLTFDAKGIREDLSDVISRISPEDTPFMSLVGTGAKVKNTLHEWQTDALAAADGANAAIEGDDIASFSAATPTVRVGNYTQISRKTLIVAGTLDAVDKAGRRGELAYQIAKRSAELKRDQETILLSNQAGNAGNSTTARKLAGFPVWLKSNTVENGGGLDSTYTSGVPTPARTDGTPAAFTETMLKNAMKAAFDAGGQPRYLLVGSANKQVVSGFSGIATKTFNRDAEKPTAIIAAADVYVSDFGKLSVIADRFQRSRDALLVDPDYASVHYLRPYRVEELAKTGDAEKRMLLCEYTLVVKNEAAHAGVFDLT